MFLEEDYIVILVGAHIGTECADMAQLITVGTGCKLLPWMLLVRGSHGYRQRWMVSCNGVCHGGQVASVSGLIRIAHLEGPELCL